MLKNYPGSVPTGLLNKRSQWCLQWASIMSIAVVTIARPLVACNAYSKQFSMTHLVISTSLSAPHPSQLKIHATAKSHQKLLNPPAIYKAMHTKG